MNRNLEKKVKSLISGLLVNDDNKVNMLVNELTEAIIPNKEDMILNSLIESFKGDRDV